MRLSPFGLPDRWFAPPPVPGRVTMLLGRRFAHRGLHGPVAVENSRAAFRAAIAAGAGIECDVRIARDGRPMVFHDATLERLTGRSGAIDGMTSAELARVALAGSDETIPTLDEMLALVGGRVPLLIEMKVDGRSVGGACLAVRRALEGYRGPVAVMAFNPEVSRWFASHAPYVTRGLVLSQHGRSGWRTMARMRLALWRARPDFLAFDVGDLPSAFAAGQRARGLPLLGWTVRGAEPEGIDAPIFEAPVVGTAG